MTVNDLSVIAAVTAIIAAIAIIVTLWAVVDTALFIRSLRCDRHAAYLQYFAGITEVYREHYETRFEFRVQLGKDFFEFEAPDMPTALTHAKNALGYREIVMRLWVHKFDQWFEVTS